MSGNLRDQLQASLGRAYTLERELGGGGMSRVFVASDTELGRPVVVKVLAPELAAALSAERFTREVRLAARLQQANIVPVLSAGEAVPNPGDPTSPRLPYYTMPFVEGESLRARLAGHGPLSITEAVSVLRDVARALVYAHGQGVVHRDIKPENVLLSGGTGMVIDFGIAKAIVASRTTAGTGVGGEAGLTEIGMALGTPAYMAPEQAAGDPGLDHRADLYAFGCLAYEVLTGAPPFGQRAPHALFGAHLGETPAPVTIKRADTPAALAGVVMRCLEKSPGARPQSAREVLDAIDSVTTPSGVSTMPGRRRRVGLTIAGAGALVVVGASGYGLSRRAAAPNPAHTIAVIPLVVANADTAQDYFSDGITDELTTALQQVPGLAVINRGSAYQFKGKSVDVRDVASKLHVDHIVELRVRRAGATADIHADLVNSGSGVAVWSHEYQPALQDVRAAEDEIARTVAARLQGGGAAPSGLTRHQPAAEAHDAYLRGRYILNRAGSAQDFDRARDYFRRAMAADSLYADPYAAAGLSYTIASGLTISPLEAYPRADSLARKGLELDERNAEAHTLFGWCELVLRWDWSTAQHELERALALDPNNAAAHQVFADLWLARGEIERAVHNARESVRLDPAFGIYTVFLIFDYVAAGQPDSAIAAQRRLDELNPDFFFGEAWVADAFRAKGLLDTALTLDRAASRHMGRATSGLVVSLAALGRHEEARAAYRELEAANKRELLSPEWLARAAVAAGDRNAALSWLEKAVAMHSDFILFTHRWPDMRTLVAEPRYQRLLKRMGLQH